MRATLLKVTAALMVTLVALIAQAAPMGPTYTNLVVQGYLKNNLNAAIDGSLTNVTFTIVQNGVTLQTIASQTVVCSSGAFSHSLTVTAGIFTGGAQGSVTVGISIPAQTLTNSQIVTLTLNPSTVPTAFVAERVAPVNTTDTSVGGSIAVGKVVVLGQDGKLPAVDGGNITVISSSVLSGALPAISAASLIGLNPANMSSGLLPAGVSISAAAVASGTLPSGVSIAATQILSGALPDGVSILATQVSSGTLPVAVSVMPASMSGGSLPTVVSVFPASISYGGSGAAVVTIPTPSSYPTAVGAGGTETLVAANFTLVHGASVTFTAPASVSGANPTLNVNSTGAKLIATMAGTNFNGMQLRPNMRYRAIYDATINKWLAEQVITRGSCTTASVTAAVASPGVVATCNGVPASTSVVINCNNVTLQSTANAVVSARATGVAHQIHLRSAAAGTASVYNCIWQLAE